MDGTVLGQSCGLSGGFELERLIKAYEAAEKVLRGMPLDGDLTVKWNDEVRNRFIQFMEASGKSQEYIRDCLSYLDRHVHVISKPEDVIEVFNKCKRGRDHLDRALRNLFNFYEVVERFPEDLLNRFRKAMPKIGTSVDFKEVTEDDVIETFNRLNGYAFKYRVIYRVILDSGLREAHVLHMIRTFNLDRLENLDEFSRYTLGLERGTKRGFYAYMRKETAEMVKELVEKGDIPCRNSVKSFLNRHRELVKPKYIRKFSYNKMVMVGIPETVADFINGRSPRTVGGRHYMFLKTQADKYYPRYVNYLKELEEKIKQLN
jgi:intergrase/recombinase